MLDSDEFIRQRNRERRAGQSSVDHRRGQTRGRRNLPAAAQCGRAPHAALPLVCGRGAFVASGAQSSACQFGCADSGRFARRRQAAVTGRADAANVRPTRWIGQQCVVLLSDPGRRNHDRRMERSDGHERPGSVVPVASGRAGASQSARRNRQHYGHPCRTAAQELRGLLDREGRTGRHDAFARARTRAGGPRQCGRAGADIVAGR